ncbi:MAG: DNA topoisomerase VI subunit B [Deltaproteobacteria bacterium]|nr:DNA topoisomerase VI subunit B [Deltaproteobacteria bacterium]
MAREKGAPPRKVRAPAATVTGAALKPAKAEAAKPEPVRSEAPVEVAEGGAPRAKPRATRRTAEVLAEKQREISVSEFFTKNRHLLGFDNPAKALLTTVKEAVDNSLDACEEAGILPVVHVALQEVGEDRHRVIVEDNGPGIIKQQVPKIFGKLLYGSKFHRLKQSRGQQGIGISAAGMYGQLTTGKPVVITSRTAPGKPAHQYEIVLDTRRNAPEILAERDVEWSVEHGTRVEIELHGSYKAGRRSVDEYLEQVAIANPHAEVHYAPPKGRAPLHLARAAHELPPEPAEIKPHPYGVELGMLIKLLKESRSRNLSDALQADFSRVTAKVAEEICAVAGVSPKAKPANLTPAEMERLFRAVPKVKIMAPSTACIVPIGEDLIRRGLEREIKADLYVSVTRPPAVYRGYPFRVEAGLAYGGDLRTEIGEEGAAPLGVKAEDRGEGPITLIRFANRVPLQYQQSACAILRTVVETNWKQYGLAQPRGSLPIGPMVLLVHMASVWVPFTSESKEAIAHYPEIMKEMALALRDLGRRLASYLRQKEHLRLEARRRSIFEMYAGELAHALAKLTGKDEQRLRQRLVEMTHRHAGGDEVAELAGIGAGGDAGTEAVGPGLDGTEEPPMEAGLAADAPRSKKGGKKSAGKGKKAPEAPPPVVAKRAASRGKKR